MEDMVFLVVITDMHISSRADGAAVRIEQPVDDL